MTYICIQVTNMKEKKEYILYVSCLLNYWYCFCILLLGQTFGVLICTWFHANSSGRKTKWDTIFILWGNYRDAKMEDQKFQKKKWENKEGDHLLEILKMHSSWNFFWSKLNQKLALKGSRSLISIQWIQWQYHRIDSMTLSQIWGLASSATLWLSRVCRKWCKWSLPVVVCHDR